MDRKLAAILAADIVGFSKMMGADEAGTLNRIERFCSTVLGPEIAGNRGKMFKSMGDGWLVEFASVVDAINCSMKVQDGLSHNGSFKLRIGVHIGDVIEQRGDIFGDGVNVAARLEGVAEPGGIAISDITYSSLDGTLSPSFDDAGERELKNIDRPVRVWIRSSSHGGEDAPERPDQTGKTQTGFPRLVFSSVMTPSDDAEVSDLADALTYDFRAHLSSIRWLDMRDSQPAQPCYQLRCVLRSSRDRLRLEATCVDPRGHVVGRRKQDGMLSDSFAFQDDASEGIPGEMMGAILDAELAAVAGKTPDEMTAEECLLAGMMAYRSVSGASFENCLTYYASAIEKDPSRPDAYAEAIFMTIGGGTTGFRGQLARFFDLLADWVRAAEPMRQDDPLLDMSVAVAAYMTDQEIAPLSARVRDCLRRAPFDVQVLVFSGWGLLWSGQAGEALDCFLKTEKLGRFSPYLVSAFGGASTAHVLLGNDDEAIRYAEKGLETAHEYPTLFAALAAACAHKGLKERAAEAITKYMELVPGQTVAQRRAISNYGHSDEGERFYEGLLLAGMPA